MERGGEGRNRRERIEDRSNSGRRERNQERERRWSFRKLERVEKGVKGRA